MSNYTPPQDYSTPELIEAIPQDNISEIRKVAGELHEATSAILEGQQLSRADLEHFRDLRTAMKIKITEAENQLRKDIANLEAIKSDLSISRKWTTADEKRLDSAAWSTQRFTEPTPSHYHQ
ncbi:hypothetical protein [Caudoviricetes sp.]|nr:hypothetical protein [Caudoviricetes sp.]